MKINLTDKKYISDIQDEFSEMFPFLKIEIFSRPHGTGAGSEKKYMKSPDKTLGECRTIHTNGAIKIIPSMSVNDLEQNFRSVYGLSVQVFRKSGKVWLETTVTDKWSLEEQNREGAELSTTNHR